MAFTENLAQFFDKTSGHAVSATFKTAANVTIRTADVIFTNAIGNVEVFDAQFEAPQPFLHCKTTDLLNVDHTCKVVIDSITYRITNDLHDGTGTSIVLLKK